MFDDRSFDTQAFSVSAWLFAAVHILRREVVRGLSVLTRVVMGDSRL